jgi:hypothetical protein
MSITITIGTQTIIIHNHTQNILSHIYKLESQTKKGCELIIFICDSESVNFHRYEFDYLSSSKLSPKKWLLNNVLYSVSCDKTRADMKDLFNDILIELSNEYNKSQN